MAIKKSGYITLSPKHGVNPVLGACFFCGGDTGEIGLLGRLPEDAEAPRKGVLSLEPCAKCVEMMKEGVLLIEVRDGEERIADNPNPFRLGPASLVRDEFVERVLDSPEHARAILKARYAFVPQTVWRRLGLPEPEASA